MKALKTITEAVANVTVIVVCGAIIGAIGYTVSQHVSCTDFFMKLCVIH